MQQTDSSFPEFILSVIIPVYNEESSIREKSKNFF
jgi:hypothetical protein